MNETAKWNPGRKTNRGLAPEFIAQWESYLDEGMSAKAVAEVFGVAKSTVLRHYPGRGWAPKQKLAHSFTVKALNRV